MQAGPGAPTAPAPSSRSGPGAPLQVLQASGGREADMAWPGPNPLPRAGPRPGSVPAVTCLLPVKSHPAHSFQSFRGGEACARVRVHPECAWGGPPAFCAAPGGRTPEGTWTQHSKWLACLSGPPAPPCSGRTPSRRGRCPHPAPRGICPLKAGPCCAGTQCSRVSVLVSVSVSVGVAVCTVPLPAHNASLVRRALPAAPAASSGCF